jgi:UDP-N-acetylmuramyl tripeptide synthase
MSALDAKVAAARAVGRLARTAGRGGGTSLPGKLLTRLEPDAIARLAARLPQGSVVISATNGKTTSAAMAAAVLEHTGCRLVHNRAGANMASGVASTLAHASSRGGRIDGQLGLFEVDELWLDTVVPALAPRAMLLGNLFRDQLDRYGELERIADRWAALVAALPPTTALALNADDPLIADLGRGRDGVLSFGVQDRSLATAEMQHAADSTHCRRCGARYVYDAVYLGHLGVYHCPACDSRRPDPTISAVNVHLRGTDSAAFDLVTPAGTVAVTLPLPGLYNVYNALGATPSERHSAAAPSAL